MTPTDDALRAIAHPLEETPEVERPAHLRVAPDSRELLRRRRRARLLVLLGATISAASMFLLVAFHVFAVQSSFQLDKLQSQLSVEQRRYGLLRDEVATQSSPETIARAAEGLGMVRPSNVTVLHVPYAPPFNAQDSLPAPPPTPYNAVVTPSQ